MKSRTIIPLLFVAALFLGSGFFRDFVFLNVNEQLRVAYYHPPETFLSPSMAFLKTFSYTSLYYLKWVLTFAFAGLFMALTLLVVKILFADKTHFRWTLLTYGLLVILAGLFFLGGYLFGRSENGYLIARFLLGIAQSPIVLMVLVPAFKLSAWQSKNT
jgi:hypothetical protein